MSCNNEICECGHERRFHEDLIGFRSGDYREGWGAGPCYDCSCKYWKCKDCKHTVDEPNWEKYIEVKQ